MIKNLKTLFAKKQSKFIEANIINTPIKVRKVVGFTNKPDFNSLYRQAYEQNSANTRSFIKS
jgi:hypothetical protein